MRTTANIYLVNRLSTNFDVTGMVILSSPAKPKRQVLEMWYKRIKRFGLLTALNRLLYLKTVNRGLDTRALERHYFKADPISNDYQYADQILHTYNINSTEVAEFIKTRSPDLIAVCGSNVIKPEIFTLAPKGAINIHAGITPDYRSANPVEWALYNRDFKKIGVTIHFINEGIDTGDVLYQQVTDIEPGDTVFSLYCKNALNGAELMIKAISDIFSGKVKPWQPDTRKGKHYLSIKYGLVQHLRTKRNLRRYNAGGFAKD